MLMIGPTGSVNRNRTTFGKIVNAPFVKVEATKFTEVGYVGRDVESMVRDLVENAIQIVEKSSTAVYTQVLKMQKTFGKNLGTWYQKEQKQSTNQFEQMMNLLMLVSKIPLNRKKK